MDLCSACRTELPWIESACPRCALPLADARAELCGACIHRPPPFVAAAAPLHYRSPVDHLILGVKFGARLQFARLLGELFAHWAAERDLPLPDALVPVPLHPRRQRERGFNQALELARPLGRQLGIPVLPAACRRIRATDRQTRLDARTRRANVRGAFAVEAGLRAGHVAIVDDVMTTGSTVAALARALLQAGVRQVDVWCIARAEGR